METPKAEHVRARSVLINTRWQQYLVFLLCLDDSTFYFYFLSVDWFRFLTLSLTVERRFDCFLLAGGPEITKLRHTCRMYHYKCNRV